MTRTTKFAMRLTVTALCAGMAFFGTASGAEVKAPVTRAPASDEKGWQVTTVYSGPDGEDHFGITTLPWSADREDILRTAGITNRPWFVSQSKLSTALQPYHTGRDTVMIIALQGALKIMVANGESHVLNPGNPIIMRDTTGHGHAAQGIGKEALRYLVIPLELDKLDAITKRSW